MKNKNHFRLSYIVIIFTCFALLIVSCKSCGDFFIGPDFHPPRSHHIGDPPPDGFGIKKEGVLDDLKGYTAVKMKHLDTIDHFHKEEYYYVPQLYDFDNNTIFEGWKNIPIQVYYITEGNEKGNILGFILGTRSFNKNENGGRNIDTIRIIGSDGFKENNKYLRIFTSDSTLNPLYFPNFYFRESGGTITHPWSNDNRKIFFSYKKAQLDNGNGEENMIEELVVSEKYIFKRPTGEDHFYDEE